MDSKQLGALGEKIAARFLENKGYQILDRNFTVPWKWRGKRGEIDLVAKKGEAISFIEVKLLSGETSFLAEQKVDFLKRKKIAQLAQIWLRNHKIPLDSQWGIDIVSIRLDKDLKRAKVRHFKNISP